MSDTSPAAEQLRIAAIRQMDPVQRMRLAFDLSEWMRELSLSRLRVMHPDRSESQLVEQMFGASYLGASGAGR